MESIESYRSSVRTLCGDLNGRRYSDEMVNMGIRQALKILSGMLPVTDLIPVQVLKRSGNTVEIDFSPEPGSEIRSVRRADSGKRLNAAQSGRGMHTGLRFFDTAELPGPGDSLLLEIPSQYTIRGLDSASGTAVPERLKLTVCKGAAGFAMEIRARSVTEVFGKRPEDSAALLRQSENLLSEFRQTLMDAAMAESCLQDPWPEQGFPI